VANTPEELALDLSRASLSAQEHRENQLREKTTTVLSAASIVVPIAALAIGRGPAVAAIPFGAAAFAYFLCARACGAALLPRDSYDGLLGGQLLDTANASDANLRQMQASAAHYLDHGYRHNQVVLETAALQSPVEMSETPPSPKPGPPSPMPATPPPGIFAVSLPSKKPKH
jgi:hypothetical protein